MAMWTLNRKIGTILLVINMYKIIDGNKACSDIAFWFSEVASVYPITPSSAMASNVDDLISNDCENLFGAKPIMFEMQSEAGAAGSMHGALLTGSLSTTFTASQGLLLMLPNMYKMAGEMLPGVIHVASRSLATQSLSIFGDHQDIYAARQTGFCMLASTNVYDAQNLSAVAHLSAIEGSLPFIHFFDGFRTSHEINTIKKLEVKKLKNIVNYSKIDEFKKRTLNIDNAKQFGMAENEDIYFQNMESRNIDYNNMPDVINSYMTKINNIMDTDYKPFNYYGASDAKEVIVAMGSICDTVKEYLKETKDKKYGLIEVHLYRPFSIKYLLNVLPNTASKIAVLDRTKESGSIGEPLYLDVLSALKNKNITIIGGRYGLSSKNTTVSDINDVFINLENDCKDNFTVGIIDDVTNLSLEKHPYSFKENSFNIKIFGFGSDGMVSASKNLLKLTHEKEDKFVQGYFEYDSKKSGGVTVSHLRISDEVINKPFYPEKCSIVVVTKFDYLNKYDLINTLDKNSILLISTSKDSKTINDDLYLEVKEYINKNNIKVFAIDAEKIALENGIKGKISMIIEYAIFLLCKKDYKEALIKVIKNNFYTKGEHIVNSNIAALDSTYESIKTVNITEDGNYKPQCSDNIFAKILNREGNNLKVSEILSIKDGSFPKALSKNEKRCISGVAPVWNKENCIECNKCSLVCPHGVIRPFVGDFEDGKPYLMDKDKNYEIKISSENCTGCTLCVSACPGKMGNSALSMQPICKAKNVDTYFEDYENEVTLNKFTVKGSQFNKPKFEFSGACAGCAEASYIKLLTQLLGDSLVIANATGCSSIYGGSAPSTPYSIPWANSLFEDNAEFALGMYISYKQKRNRLKKVIEKHLETDDNILLKELYNNFENLEKTLKIKRYSTKEKLPEDVQELYDYIPARQVWAVGGDGWAYDIGYGGLDHVLHTNENIKVLVLDTEVYSNTGGQASKSTSLGAVAEFANMGKKNSKKDLFKMCMDIPNCYVASISLGANDNQTLKAFKEAIEHDGPAIIIAYSPCIEHGIRNGMYDSLNEQKLAVECGYTMLMRYNPNEEKLHIDSKEPNFEKYFDFLNNETRFTSLYKKNPDLANEVFENQKNLAIKRFNNYKSIENKD